MYSNYSVFSFFSPYIDTFSVYIEFLRSENRSIESLVEDEALPDRRIWTIRRKTDFSVSVELPVISFFFESDVVISVLFRTPDDFALNVERIFPVYGESAETNICRTADVKRQYEPFKYEFGAVSLYFQTCKSVEIEGYVLVAVVMVRYCEILPSGKIRGEEKSSLRENDRNAIFRNILQKSGDEFGYVRFRSDLSVKVNDCFLSGNIETACCGKRRR